MDVIDSMESHLSLKELLLNVKSVLSKSFASSYWVSAEISEIRENANGHCYLELIEKNENSQSIIEAKIRAIIYSNYYGMIKPFFLKETGSHLKVGMKILVKITLVYSEIYGLSCSILSIDPTFTLGDLAKQRMVTIQQLKEDGIWDMNATLSLAVPTQRIAVISSATAAGYGDFCNQLENNKYGFCFLYKLFPAIVQGDRAVSSIISALHLVFDEIDNFDVVVLIRGGGATTDLLAFDDYDLASEVAQFPLPVITGIGHERDESVVDMVAHTRCKTPTAVAAFLIETMLNLETKVLSLGHEIMLRLSNVAMDYNQTLDKKLLLIKQNIARRLSQEEVAIERSMLNIHSLVKQKVSDELHRLELRENTLTYLSPQRLMSMGYSFATKNGKVIRSSKELKSGDEIETFFMDNSVTSIVK